MAGRRRAITRVLVVTLVFNILAAAVKLLAALGSGSLSLLAGGLDSLSDGGANIAALAAVRAAARPPDADHPYGHRKVETLVAVGIAGALFISGGRLAWSAAEHLFAGGPPPLVSAAVLAAPVLAALINIGAASYEARAAQQLHSDLLSADARHTFGDAAISIALAAGLLAVRAGHGWVDPVLALAVSGVVVAIGASILRRAMHVLADAAALDPAAVARTANSVPGVVGAHKVRSRGPYDHVAVDLHVQVDPALGIGRAHAIGHEVSDRIREVHAGVHDVVVHIEPEWSMVDDELARTVRRVVGQFPVEAHEVRVHDADGLYTEATLHLELDPSQSLAEAHAVASAVESAVRAEAPAIARVVTHLEPIGVRHEGGSASDVLSDGYRELVEHVVATLPPLVEPHALRAVKLATGVRLSVHVRAPGSLPLPEAHALSEDLEARLKAASPELERVTIHVEPVARQP